MPKYGLSANVPSFADLAHGTKVFCLVTGKGKLLPKDGNSPISAPSPRVSSNSSGQEFRTPVEMWQRCKMADSPAVPLAHLRYE